MLSSLSLPMSSLMLPFVLSLSLFCSSSGSHSSTLNVISAMFSAFNGFGGIIQ
jgi:hypothetical protein